MRLFLPLLLGFSLTGTAVAQPFLRVTIEDDVAPAAAVKCAALRAAQTAGPAKDAIQLAARDAWLKSPGVDAKKVKAEAARLVSAAPDAMARMADDCSSFEIRSAPPAGG